MAKNTGNGSRRGAVKNRSEFKHPNGTHVKRNTQTGRIMNVSRTPTRASATRSSKALTARAAMRAHSLSRGPAETSGSTPPVRVHGGEMTPARIAADPGESARGPSASHSVASGCLFAACTNVLVCAVMALRRERETADQGVAGQS